jgi:hypothetical protein
MGGFLKGAACAAIVLPLAACGGGGGGSATPPIALKGVSYERFVALPALNETQGGEGGNFRSVLYVEGEPAGAFLGRQVPGTTQFQAEDGSVALVEALPDFESTRFIRIVRQANGTAMAPTEGVIGRFTSEALMATASGSAIYVGGPGTQDVRATTAAGAQLFDLSGGNTIVVVDFDSRRVNVALDFRGTAVGLTEDVNQIAILGMTISGNRFSGGELTSLKNDAPVAGFSASGANLASSGVFAGWNDRTGNVAGGNRPAEVAGAFVANTGPNVLTGRYLAD